MAAERIAILGDHGSELNSVSSEAETDASIEDTQSSVSVAEPEYGIEQLANAAFRVQLESGIRRAIPLAGLALRLTPERPGLASTSVDLSRWSFPARLAPLVTRPPHAVHLHQRKIPCADCGQLTVFRCDLARLHWSGGTYLYGNHPVNRRHCFGVCHTVSGEYGAFELTAFCLACRRQRLFCHYCYQCAWCTPAAWSQPAIERVEMEPQRVWEGESSEDEDYTDDTFRVTAEFAFAAAGMGMSWQIRQRGRVVHDYRSRTFGGGTGCCVLLTRAGEES